MFRQLVALLFLLAISVASNAPASSVTEEVSAVGTQQTATNPNTSSIADHVGGSWTASDLFAMHADLTATYNAATKPIRGASFGGSAGTIFLAALGLDWTPDNHWTLGFEVDGSPSSTQNFDAPVTYSLASGSTAQADAQIRSTSSSYGGTLNLGFDTAGESDYETALTLSANATHLNTIQRLSRMEGASGVVNLDAIRATCMRDPWIRGCRELSSVLAQRPARLDELNLSGSLTETLFTNTEVGLNGSYYVYNHDPATVGYFTVASLGRTKLRMGSGVQVAPYLYMVRPRVSQRFGPLSVELAYQYAEYVAHTGQSNQLGLKLQWKFSKAWKGWIAATGSSDRSVSTDAAAGTPLAETTHSLTVGGGMKYSF